MAEKKEHKIVQSEVETTADGKTITAAKPVGNSKALRIGAIALWVLGLVFEILAILVVVGKLSLKFMPTVWQLILFLVLDLVCVIIASQMWKKANHISPMSEKNKFLFWLWNNMGLIASIVCFAPIIIILLTNKDLDKKTKTIATVVAIIALLIAGVASYDFNPVSKEQQEAAMNELGDQTVYWAPFGKVYHTHSDCGSLNQTDTLTSGTVEQAIAEGRTRICHFCASKDSITDLPSDE